MKKSGICILYIYLFLYCTNVFSQDQLGINLVPNPSFEDKDYCPPHLTDQGDQLYGVKNWHCVNNHTGTPDYFNNCIPSIVPLSYESVEIPVNFAGEQSPKTGDAYAGIVSRQIGDHYTEYLAVELTEPLVQGLQYSASMWVSSADGFFLCNAGLGLFLSDQPIDGGGGFNILTTLIPQVVNRQVISDEINWVQISGKFIAKGGEKYLAIGVFNENLSTPQVKQNHTLIGVSYPSGEVHIA